MRSQLYYPIQTVLKNPSAATAPGPKRLQPSTRQWSNCQPHPEDMASLSGAAEHRAMARPRWAQVGPNSLRPQRDAGRAGENSSVSTCRMEHCTWPCSVHTGSRLAHTELGPRDSGGVGGPLVAVGVGRQGAAIGGPERPGQGLAAPDVLAGTAWAAQRVGHTEEPGGGTGST